MNGPIPRDELEQDGAQTGEEKLATPGEVGVADLDDDEGQDQVPADVKRRPGARGYVVAAAVTRPREKPRGAAAGS